MSSTSAKIVLRKQDFRTVFVIISSRIFCTRELGHGIDPTILCPYHDLTMKAAVLVAPGKLEIREIPKPQIQSDEILIRVRACAICGTDLRIYRHGHRKIELPAIIGH